MSSVWGRDWVFHLTVNNLGSQFSFLLFLKGLLNCVSYQENSFSGQRFKNSRRISENTEMRACAWRWNSDSDLGEQQLSWTPVPSPEEPEHQMGLQKPLHSCLGTHMCLGGPQHRGDGAPISWDTSTGPTAQPCWTRGPTQAPFPTGVGRLGNEQPRLRCSFPGHGSQDFQLPMSHPSRKELQDLAAAVTPLCSWCASSTGWALHPQSSPKSRAQRQMKLLMQWYSLWAFVLRWWTEKPSWNDLECCSTTEVFSPKDF